MKQIKNCYSNSCIFNIHYGMPNLIEEYVQESGWSGQGGLLSEAVLILRTGKYTGKELSCRQNTAICKRKYSFKTFCVTRKCGGV